MINSEISLWKHIDKMLKLINQNYSLKISRNTPLEIPSWRAVATSYESGRSEMEVKVLVVLDRYVKDSDDFVRIELDKMLNLLGLMGKQVSIIQSGYQNLDAYAIRYVGRNKIPKFNFVKPDGAAGDQTEICIMTINTLGGSLWSEFPPVAQASPDIRQYRLNLILTSYLI